MIITENVEMIGHGKTIPKVEKGDLDKNDNISIVCIYRCLMQGGKVLVHCNDGMSRAPALVENS